MRGGELGGVRGKLMATIRGVNSRVSRIHMKKSRIAALSRLFWKQGCIKKLFSEECGQAWMSGRVFECLAVRYTVKQQHPVSWLSTLQRIHAGVLLRLGTEIRFTLMIPVSNTIYTPSQFFLGFIRYFLSKCLWYQVGTAKH